MGLKLHLGQASVAYNCNVMFHGKCGGHLTSDLKMFLLFTMGIPKPQIGNQLNQRFQKCITTRHGSFASPVKRCSGLTVQLVRLLPALADTHPLH